MRPDGPVRPGRDRKVAALELLALAHRVSTGEIEMPCDGQGPTRVHGRVVIPPAVHRVLCGFHTSTRWETAAGDPVVAECRGCGLLRVVDDDQASPDPPQLDDRVADVLAIRRSAR